MKKQHILAVSIIASIILVRSIYVNTIGLSQIRQVCRTEKTLAVMAVVKNIVQDSNNHPTSNIYMNNNVIFVGSKMYTFGLWNKVDIGDSIVKKSGQMSYYIYKANYNFDRIDTFYKEVNCDTIIPNVLW